jgi:flagellar hook-associated protein 1 FlgK
MSGLLSIFGNAGNALGVIQQALGAIQNNVSNASTPGYASQRLNITARPFDAVSGAAGGIAAQGLISSRDSYADSAVQQSLQSLGLYTAQAQGTSAIQGFFDASGSNGVSAALTNLYTAFSAWGASPTDPTAGQTVVADAAAFASSVSGLSKSLNATGSQLNQQISSTVGQINALGTQIQQYNELKLKSTTPDPGADANLENTLESLSQLTNYTALSQPDGTVTVLIGGGTPLVIGSEQYNVSANVSVNNNPPATNPQSPPTSQILDSQGHDITADVTGGQLGGLLDTRNRVLASIIGDSQHQGTLNQFAQGVADKVNTILESGTVSTAPGAAAGSALFTYNNSDPTLAAGTLAVSSTITPAQLAPVDASGNAGGNANQLAALADPNNTQAQIGGQDFVSFFAGIAAGAGQESSTAQTNQTVQQQVSSQAQSQRDQISKVSLDGQAAELLQFQRGYQAISNLLAIVNDTATSLINLITEQQ